MSVDIASVKENGFWYISKDYAISIMKNSNLNERTELLWIIFLI